MQGRSNGKRGGKGQRVAADAWGKNDTGSKNQSGSNLDWVGRVKSGYTITNMRLVNKKSREIIIW